MHIIRQIFNYIQQASAQNLKDAGSIITHRRNVKSLVKNRSPYRVNDPQPLNWVRPTRIYEKRITPAQSLKQLGYSVQANAWFEPGDGPICPEQSGTCLMIVPGKGKIIPWYYKTIDARYQNIPNK